jgi:hypothetical protein
MSYRVYGPLGESPNKQMQRAVGINVFWVTRIGAADLRR